LTAYEDLAEEMIKNRSNRLKLTINQPMILLCIRVTVEAVFKICYIGFWKTRYFSILCNKMSSLLSYLFDPECNVLSKLPPIECKYCRISHSSETQQPALRNERLLRRSPESPGRRKLHRRNNELTSFRHS